MNIEVGDLFVVTRGFELGDQSMLFSLFGGGSPARQSRPHYDRSHEGLVYQAEEVCGPVIAAKCVYGGDSYKAKYVGKSASLNTREVEVWPVTQRYIDTLKAANEPAAVVEGE